MSKKNINWNEMTEKQQAKARHEWRYGTWRETLKDFVVLMSQRPAYPDAQVKSDPLNARQVLLIVAALLVALVLMYLMAQYLIPANIG